MNVNILDFSDINAGWMNMNIYDYNVKEVRKMRISYLQNFFNDLLMACKFLLSDITGGYELDIDQEGFDASLKFYKFNIKANKIHLEINEDFFEDEVPYNGSSEDWENFHNSNKIPTLLTYSDVDMKSFIINILELIEKYKEDYNNSFAMSPADEVNENLLEEIWKMYNKKCVLGSEDNEKISNT